MSGRTAVDVALQHDVRAVAVQQVLHLQSHALVLLHGSVQSSSSHAQCQAACRRLPSTKSVGPTVPMRPILNWQAL